ncbi:pyrroloquinoline quinone biosynthesis protein PqqE [Dactylosporangium roseum]|uniref:PqqA peptide cyclase n=1 Tax=Dactylosporangium roseum TaxID=47989 RepID=A0ABY5ZA06_9ACTN|nr:pyrroloquinoline quinone biosynthesis protein PqqE [Dactylosporangium roseum]UWZ38930.1 pyrroloquinoline quinone biosynthesis protein PqqE [Dactylosporangium roseum]
MTGPGLRRGVRLVFDPVRDQHALLYPEGVLLLDPVAADVVAACDGRRDLAGIVGRLAREYDDVDAADVGRLLADLSDRRLLTPGGTGRPGGAAASGTGAPPWASDHPRPTGLLAELTYRCPLRCAYCSNPVEPAAYRAELGTAEWADVLDQARAAGVLQVHFSGGEPLLRRDLPELVGQARGLGMYTNLVTSGVPLTGDRLAALLDAGLDHLQLSIQDSRRADADRVAGGRFHDRKLAAAGLVRESGTVLSVNVVLHAGNVARLGEIAELAVDLGAERLELAHTQFYGWGLRNRAALMPTRAQVDAAAAAVAEVHDRHGDRVEIVYVEPDHHTGRPKPCMNGWGSRQLVVAPNGDVLPCLAAGQLPGPAPPNVHSGTLADLWQHSALFNAFRGTAWMPEPCRGCDLRTVDFGGCRCQAFQLTGDPAATDPACLWSPHHGTVLAAAGTVERPPMIPRRPP